MKKRIETINNKRIVYSSDDNVIRKDEINIKKFLEPNPNLVDKTSPDVFMANTGYKTNYKVITEDKDLLWTATEADAKKNSNLTAGETYLVFPMYHNNIIYFCRKESTKITDGYKAIVSENGSVSTAMVSSEYYSFSWADEASTACKLGFYKAGEGQLDKVTANIIWPSDVQVGDAQGETVTFSAKTTYTGNIYAAGIERNGNKFALNIYKVEVKDKPVNCGNK